MRAVSLSARSEIIDEAAGHSRELLRSYLRAWGCVRATDEEIDAFLDTFAQPHRLVLGTLAMACVHDMESRAAKREGGDP